MWSITPGARCGRLGSTADRPTPLGLLRVCADDFLVVAPDGPVREAVLKSLTSFGEFEKERTLTPEVSLAVLGV